MVKSLLRLLLSNNYMESEVSSMIGYLVPALSWNLSEITSHQTDDILTNGLLELAAQNPYNLSLYGRMVRKMGIPFYNLYDISLFVTREKSEFYHYLLNDQVKLALRAKSMNRKEMDILANHMHGLVKQYLMGEIT